MVRSRKSFTRDRRSTALWTVATIALVVAVVLIGWGTRGADRTLPAPVAMPPETTLPIREPTHFLARSTPVRLLIRSISLSVPLTSVGLNPDGTVQVPPTVGTPGWYRLGPSPGQDGSAVILGHVDSYFGPDVFIRLRRLLPGNVILVVLANGKTARFKVTSVKQYLKTAFPSAEVYRSRGFSALQLVTCGGRFDAATGSYESNVVVFSTRI